MKTTITLLLLVFFTIGASAQWELPVTFENEEEDTAWTQFANSGDLPENFVLADNPDDGDINPSLTCIMFTVLEGADPWAGAWADSYDSVEITEDNYMMQMMVMKDVISPCRLKLEQGRGGEQFEVADTNTVTDLWELMEFDMSEGMGNAFQRLVFFPDFPDPRETGSICYIDNIGFAGVSAIRKVNNLILKVYPNPAKDVITIQYPEISRVTITNVIGQRIKSLEFLPVSYKVVDVSSLDPGVYFLTLDTAEGIVSTRFIKQ